MTGYRGHSASGWALNLGSVASLPSWTYGADGPASFPASSCLINQLRKSVGLCQSSSHLGGQPSGRSWSQLQDGYSQHSAVCGALSGLTFQLLVMSLGWGSI